MRRYRSGGPVRGHGGVAVPDSFAMVRAFDSDSNPARPIRPSPLAASTIHGLPLDLIDRLTDGIEDAAGVEDHRLVAVTVHPR